MNRGSKPPPMRLALWIVAILMSLVVAPVYGTPAVAAAIPTPTSTPSGASYFITWRGGGSDTAVFSTAARGEYTSGIFGGSYEEYQKSISVRGSAVVRLNPQGNQFTSIRILWAADSYQRDEKDHETWRCGDIVIQHDHTSLVETNMTPKYPFPIMAPPAKRPDGAWVIKNLYPEWSDSGVHSHYYANCYGPSNRMIVNRNEIHAESINFSRWIIDGAPPGTFDVEATNPDGSLFSKKVSFETNDIGPLGRPPLKLQVSWEITVRRIGKCLVAGSIPINDTTDYKLIDDEDVEMGVEYGKSSIDPDTGVAPLNIRVTCDQVPIKNAKVDVKVEVQKSTGGHLHDAADRPRGSLNGIKLTDNKPSQKFMTDDDGRVHLTFKPGKAQCCLWKKQECVKKDCPDIGIAGIYKITATSAHFPDRKAEVAVEAKVDGLSRLDADPNYVDDVGGAAHCSGDNATAPTKQKLRQFAAAFEKAQGDHNQELAACGAPQWPIYPLWVIDVSLPFGGLYDDLNNNWSTPHQTHGHGDGVDFSANSAGWHQTTYGHTVVIQSGRCPTCPRSWPDVGATIPICDGYIIAPEGWLMMTMMRLGTKYGRWDNSDLCSDYKNKPHTKCPGDALWHLHVNQ